MRWSRALIATFFAIILGFALPCLCSDENPNVVSTMSPRLPISDNALMSYLMLRKFSLGECLSSNEEDEVIDWVHEHRDAEPHSLIKILLSENVDGISLLSDALTHNQRALHFLLSLCHDEALVAKWSSVVVNGENFLSLYLKSLNQKIFGEEKLVEEFEVIKLYSAAIKSSLDLQVAKLVVEEMRLAAKRDALHKGNQDGHLTNFYPIIDILENRLRDLAEEKIINFTAQETTSDSEETVLYTAGEKKRKGESIDSRRENKRQKRDKGSCQSCPEVSSLYPAEVNKTVALYCLRCFKRYRTNGSCEECKFALYSKEKRKPCLEKNCTGHLHRNSPRCSLCKKESARKSTRKK